MKISSEDPIITAYTLGELDDSSRARVEEALVKDDALAAEGAALASLSSLLTETLQGESLSLGQERLGFVGLSRFQTTGPSGMGQGEAASGGASGNESSSLSVTHDDRHFDSAPSGELGDGQAIALVLDREPVDPSFVQRSLDERGELPPREEYSVERWVNAGAIVSPPMLTVSNLGVYTELGPCAWDDEKSLLLVNLRSLDGEKVSVKASLTFNPEAVMSSQLLGSSESLSEERSQTGVMKDEQSFLYLVELLPNLESIGAIDLEVEDELDGYLPLVDLLRNKDEVSDDFIQTRVLAEYAQWGASEERQADTLKRLADEARDLLSRVTSPRVRYALDMILLSEEALSK